MKYECKGQISLFELMEEPADETLTLACDTCGYCKKGCCSYPNTPDDHCVLGDKKVSVKPGDWVEEDMLGEKMNFDDIVRLVGKMIIMDRSTESHAWYKVVLVEKIVMNGDQRRLVYYDGERHRGLVNEMYFNENLPYPERAWSMK